MSGGHWDYSGFKIESLLGDIGSDEAVAKRFPKLSKLLVELGPILYQIEHEIDWDRSFEQPIKDDRKLEADALRRQAVVFEKA